MAFFRKALCSWKGETFLRLGFSRFASPICRWKVGWNEQVSLQKYIRPRTAYYCTSTDNDAGAIKPEANHTIPRQSDDNIDVNKTHSKVITDSFYRSKPICPSCGSSMHNLNPSMPGYLDPNVLSKYIGTDNNSTNWMNSLICKRCFDMKNHNNMPVITTNPQYAREMLSSRIPNSRGLIIYLIDLMNVCGSTLPSIERLIGNKKRVIIVGTKLDLVPMEEKGQFKKQMKHLKEYVTSRCIADGLDQSLIKDVCLISAKTGSGVDELALLINRHRGQYMPVYFIGCTNTGKSTLFNTIQNLFTAHKEELSFPNQALTHFYPGSTIGYVRQRLTFSRVDRLRRRLNSPPPTTQEPQTGLGLFDESFIKETFGEKDATKSINHLKETPTSNRKDIIHQKDKNESILDYELMDDETRRSDSNWMYDTPGVIRLDQVLRFLTAKEIKLMQQTNWIVPRTAILSPGLVLCLGGLAHIHYNDIKRQNRDTNDDKEIPKANQSIFLTVVCPHNIPLHVTTLKKVDSLMERHRKDLILKIPFDYDARGFDIPSMKAKEYNMNGNGWDVCSSDLSIHGIGWVGVTAGMGSIININVSTPDGIGQDLYTPSYMPYSVRNRGKRGSKDLGNRNTALYDGTRKKNPQLLANKLNTSFTEEWTQHAKERLQLQNKLSKMQRSNYLLESGVNPGSKKFANTHNERLTAK